MKNTLFLKKRQSMLKSLVVTLSFLLVCSANVFAQKFIYPTPAKVIQVKNEKRVVVVSKDMRTKGNCKYTKQLARYIDEQLEQQKLADTKTKQTITLLLADSVNLDKEAYELTVNEQGVQMKASSQEGIYHATRTFLQMVRFGKGKLGYCTIKDSPRYEWRGYMLDESRHFFGKEKVKQYLDLMAMMHMNVFHWHLTDEQGWRVEIKRYPKLTQEGAVGNWHDPKAAPLFYTQEDIKEIVAYAAERHIMVMPEFDMPGHATAVCRSYPEVSGGTEGKRPHFTFHPCKEETFTLISNIFDELFELFPCPYVHIGGDEVHFGNQSWFTDPTIQNFIKEHHLNGVKGMELHFIERIVDMVNKKGKIAVAWDGLVEAGIAPEKVLVMWWKHERPNLLKEALAKGYDVIMTPRLPLYGDFTQFATHKEGRQWDGYARFEDIYEFPCKLVPYIRGYEKQIKGIQFTMWTERVADNKRLDYMTFPRLVAVAEAGWTPVSRIKLDTYLQRISPMMNYLKELGIYYFDLFDPVSTPEPTYPRQPKK